MEDSKSSDQLLCPCGFYGSAKTMGLCSKCYKEKSKDVMKSAPDHMIPTSEPACVSVSSTFPEASSSKEDISDKVQLNNICGTSNSTNGTVINTNDKNTNGNDSPSPTCSTSTENAGLSPEKKGSKRDISNVEADSTPESTPEKQSQKVKKRCFQCKCKLELAQRQIGRCKCDNVFCALHRLPELHNCDFDHKEDGRREAREKMVKPVRHLGTSFKRLDTDT
ncbi:AN1-type zinc finger protein 3 homolog [Mytilus galloprovincialis]|uniref:AN1-type zinc finger protein 3 homolog n=1 Tax=Mytilus galloprovincialis TaxID=29158 RepID=UPI003F7BB4BE